MEGAAYKMNGDGDPFADFARKHGFDTDEEPKPPEELFVDLAAIIKNGLQPERPTIARVSEDKCLLYAGRLNEIHGEPGVGKTNHALCLALAVMADGGHVLFIDPEDTPAETLRKLAAFNAEMDMVVKQFHYLHNPTQEDLESAISWAANTKPELVVLDGLAKALMAEAKNEDKPGDILWSLCRAWRGSSHLRSCNQKRRKSRPLGSRFGREVGAL